MGVTDLTGLSPKEVRRALGKIVFTAARYWMRSVRIDKDTRDLLVRSLAADEEARRLREWLETIERITDDEIGARFRTDSQKTETEMAKNSKVYPLLQIPRDIARRALRGDAHAATALTPGDRVSNT